ncbi:MAG: hypothetical protein ACNA7V_14665, partial [Bacteroidales bacterium]
LQPDTLQGQTESLLEDEMAIPLTEKVFFMVQLFASSEPADIKSPGFKGIDSIEMIKEEGLYKYFTGKTESYHEVSLTKDRMVGTGFTDAFVVAYKGRDRISVKAAASLKK